MTTYILQVLGKKFKKLSWTKFVDMIINNELSSHNELGEYKLTTKIYIPHYKLQVDHKNRKFSCNFSHMFVIITTAQLGGAKTTTDSKTRRTSTQQKSQSQPVKAGFTVNDPDVWVSNHWTPYWYNCGLCLPELRPDFILHMDKLGRSRRS